MPVTITAVDTIQLSVPLDTWAPPPMFAGKPRTHVEAIYVKVTCSNGIVGWGECFGSSGSIVIAAFDKWVRQLAVGKDPADQSLMPGIERLLHGLGRAGPVMHALSGLDIALWDIRGKLEGVSVSKLLGGAKRKRVETYASLLQYSGDVGHVKRNTERALKLGYKHIKLHECLFKLHSPLNFIVGGGVFAYANSIPCSLAWEAFGVGNGATCISEMRQRIIKYRRSDPADRGDFIIGCRILTQPFFFPEPEWIPVPASWSPNIVTFKSYDTSESDGKALWNAIQDRVSKTAMPPIFQDQSARYGNPILVQPRLGQGTFRVMVTDAYNRKCAITGERTLPALEAAHIKPYADGGSHEPQNGLLLRRDIHALFDGGYVTVTPDLKFHVRRRIKEEFENGRHYYALQGRPIAPPTTAHWTPDPRALSWHNDVRFRA